MNKKTNTVLFILGATVVNILVMLIVLVVGLILVARLPESFQESAGQIIIILLFFIAIAVSFVSYNRFMKFLSAKIDMDKYFHPIFKQRRPPNPRPPK